MKGEHNGRGEPQGRGTNKNHDRTKKTAHSQEPDKKEMLFVPKNAGKMQGRTCKKVKEHILNELQKDSEHGEDLATD